MSGNFRWFLRFIIYIPLVIALIISLSYSYLTSKFEQNFSACLVQVPIDAQNKSPRDVAALWAASKVKVIFLLVEL